MSSQDKIAFLYNSATMQKHAEVEATNIDVFFPDDISGWSDVLDCRISPYTEQTLEELCHFAEHVRKPYILVTASQVGEDAPL